MKKMIKSTMVVSILLTVNNIAYAEENSNADKITDKTIEIKQNQVTEEQYLENVSDFSKLNIEEVYSKFNSAEGFTLYLGRKTCPHCREFSPVLKEFNTLLNNKLNYYDIESTDLDEKAQVFFWKLGIPGVPVVMYVKSGNVVNGWAGGGITAQGLYDRFFPKIENSKKEDIIVEKLDNYIPENKQQSSNSLGEKKEDIKIVEDKVVKVVQPTISIIKIKENSNNKEINQIKHIENKIIVENTKNEKEYNNRYNIKKLPKTSCVK